MFESKTEEEIDKMNPQEFEKYSNDLAQSGIKAEELEVKSDSDSDKKDEKKDDQEKDSDSDSEDKSNDDKSKDKSDDDKDDDEDDDDDSGNKKPEDGKPSPAMPLSKYNKAKEKWDIKMAEKEKSLEEATAQLAVLKSQLDEINSAKSDLSDDDFESYIKKSGADPEAIKDLIKVISKKVSSNATLDPETKKRLDVFEAKQQEAAEISAYENDFNSNIAKLIRKDDPNISSENLEKAKEKLKELAYSDKYHKYDLKDVFLLNKSSFAFKSEKKKTFESSRPSGSDHSQETDYSEITPDDIEKMSPAEFEKYSEAMAKAQGNERFKISN